MKQIPEPIFEKLNQLLGKKNTERAKTVLEEVLANEELQFELDLALANIKIMLDGWLVCDEQNQVTGLHFEHEPKLPKIEIPGWDALSCEFKAMQLDIDVAQARGKLAADLTIGSVHLQLSGGPKLTEQGLGWWLTTEVSSPLTEIFKDLPLISDGIAGLSELLGFDISKGLIPALVLSQNRIALSFALKESSIGLFGGLKLFEPRMAIRYDHEKKDLELELEGQLELGKENAVAVLVAAKKEGKAFELSFKVKPEPAMALSHLILPGNPLDEALTSLPVNMQTSVKEESRLNELKTRLKLSKDEKAIDLDGKGSLLGLEGGVHFGLRRHDAKSVIAFTLSQENAALKSVQDLLIQHLGVIEEPIAGRFGEVLGNLQLELTNLDFQQKKELIFKTASKAKLGESAAYANTSSFELKKEEKKKKLDISLKSTAEADEPPLSIGQLLTTLHPDLEELDLPKGTDKLVKSLLSPAISDFDFSLKSDPGVLELKATLTLIEKIEGELLLNLDVKKKQLHFTLTSSSEITLKDLLEACGIEVPEGLPSLMLNLKKLHFQSNGVLKVSCTGEIDSHQAGTFKLDAFDLSIDIPKKTYHFKANTAFDLAEDLLPVTIGAKGEVALKKAEKLSFNLKGDLHIEASKFAFEIDLTSKEKTFKATAKEIRLSKALDDLVGITLPLGVPDPELKLLELSYTHKKSLHTKLKITDESGLSLGDSDLKVEQLEFELKAEKGQKWPKISLTSSISLNLENAIVIEKGDLHFELDAKDNKPTWSLGGSMDLSFFQSQTLQVSASYQYEEKSQSISLDILELPEVNFIDEIRLDILAMGFSLSKAKGKAVALSLHGSANLATPLADINNGSLELVGSTEELSLSLSCETRLDLLKNPGFPYATLIDPTFTIGFGKKGWQATGSCQLQFQDIPTVLDKLFPTDQVEATMSLGSAENFIMLSLLGPGGSDWQLTPIPIPPDAQEHESDLGLLYVGANHFKFDLFKALLSADVYVGLPHGINNIFKNSNDEVLEIFRTTQSGNPAEAVSFQLNMGVKGKSFGLSIKMTQSPFQAFDLDDDGNLLIDMKVADGVDFGAFMLKAPEFSLSANKLKAKGGLKIVRELGLPTTLYTWFLKQVGLDDLANLIQPKIPFTGVNFAPKEGDDRVFKSDAFLELFVKDGKHLFPDWARKLFDTIDDIGSKLPNDLLEYGDIRVPKSFDFSLELSVPNNLRFNVSFKDPEDPDSGPLRILVPQFPQLIGMELYSLGFGELWNGSLFHVDMDYSIDDFDLAGIFTSLALHHLPGPAPTALPSPKDLRRRYRFGDVMMLIIYQTKIPIPIPLFYEELSIKVVSVEGTDAQLQLSFPRPEFGKEQVKALSQLAIQALKFFNNPKEHEINFDFLKGLDLTTFTIGPNHWQFPEYIAKQKNGSDYGPLILEHDGIEIGIGRILAAVLNAMYKGSFNEFIKTYDLDKRVSQKDIKLFEAIEMEVGYALTTPFEFIDEAWEMLKLDPKTKKDHFLSMLPGPVEYPAENEYVVGKIEEGTEGVVTFFNSQMDWGDSFHLQNSMGLIFTGNGFGTGGQFEMNLGPDLITGLLQFQALVKSDRLSVKGEASLKALGWSLFDGKITVENGKFGMEASALEPNEIFYIHGGLDGEITKDKLFLSGNARISLFGFTEEGRVIIDSGGDPYFEMSYTQRLFSLLESTCKLRIEKSGLMGYLGYKLGPLLSIDIVGGIFVRDKKLLMNGAMRTDFLSVKGAELKSEIGFSEHQLDFDTHFALANGFVQGEVKGLITMNYLLLKGAVAVDVLGTRLDESNLTLTTQNESDLELFLAGTLLGSDYKLSGAVSADGMSLEGYLNPITWGLGPFQFVKIGKTVFEVSTSTTAITSAYFKGEIGLLGISNSQAEIKLLPNQWTVDFNQEFRVPGFSTTTADFKFQMRQGFWVKGDFALRSFINLVIPEVKLTFKVLGYHWSLTLLPEIHLADIEISHNLQFNLYQDQLLAEKKAALDRELKDLEIKKAAAAKALGESQDLLDELKKKGISKINKEVEAAYIAYSQSSGLDKQLDIVREAAKTMETRLKNLLDPYYSNQLTPQYEALDESLRNLCDALERIGFNFYEDRPTHLRHQKTWNEKLENSGLHVILQKEPYNMAREGGRDSLTAADMRKNHAGDEFLIDIYEDHCLLRQGDYLMAYHKDFKKHDCHTSAQFVRLPHGQPLEGNRGGYHFNSDHFKLDLDYTQGITFKSIEGGRQLSFPGGGSDRKEMQWRPSGSDYYVHATQVRAAEPPSGDYRIKCSYEYFMVRPGGSHSTYKVDFRKAANGDIINLNKTSEGYVIKQGSYYMCIPGSRDVDIKAEFRRIDKPTDAFEIEYDEAQKGHYIKYGNYYLALNTNKGYLEFRSDGPKTILRLFKTVSHDNVIRTVQDVFKHSNRHFNNLADAVDKSSGGLKQSCGLFDDPAVDAYKKAESELAEVYYLEDRVMEDKEKVIHLEQEIEQKTIALKELERALDETKVNFLLESTSTLSVNGHSITLNIPLHIEATNDLTLKGCLEALPKAIEGILLKNPLNIFSPLRTDSAMMKRSNPVQMPASLRDLDLSKLKHGHEYKIEEKTSAARSLNVEPAIVHKLDEFLG